MDVAAVVTSKGQVTIPKAVRDALRIGAGDRLLFRVDGQRATLARSTDLLDLAGSVRVPPDKRSASWDRIRSETRRARAK